MTQTIIPRTDHDLAQQSIFDKAVAIVLDTLSPTSRRVYLRTYRAWTKFANDHSFDAMALTLDNIRAFIHEADVAKTARQNRLSHMRKLLELLAIGDGHYRQHYSAVKLFLRVQANDSDKSRAERVNRALNPHEATAFLGVLAKRYQGCRHSQRCHDPPAGLHRSAPLGANRLALERYQC